VIDSRRETGVFRAIGAKRAHIAQIYSLYTLLLMLAAYCLAVLVSAVFALFMTQQFSDDITAEIAGITGGDLDSSFSFFGITLLHHVYILVGAIVLGWVGAIIPVAKSLRKDPLRYLRED
jgi:ABC-type antimicrobial peptide transport system permease subunit